MKVTKFRLQMFAKNFLEKPFGLYNVRNALDFFHSAYVFPGETHKPIGKYPKNPKSQTTPTIKNVYTLLPSFLRDNPTQYLCCQSRKYREWPSILKHDFGITSFTTQSEHLKQLSVTHNSDSLKYIKNPTDDLVLRAMESNNPEVISYIAKPSLSLQQSALKYFSGSYSDLLSCIKGPHPEILNSAVRSEPACISYIYNPSVELQMIAVKLDPLVISLIKSPSHEVQVMAVKKDISAVKSNLNEESKSLLLKEAGYLSYDTTAGIKPAELPDSVKVMVVDEARSYDQTCYLKIEFDLNEEAKLKLMRGEIVETRGDDSPGFEISGSTCYVSINTKGFLEYVHGTTLNEGGSINYYTNTALINRSNCQFPKQNEIDMSTNLKIGKDPLSSDLDVISSARIKL